jgi:hypothetical protein
LAPTTHAVPFIICFVTDIGRIFGHLTITGEAPRRRTADGRSRRMVIARCVCGQIAVVRWDSLITRHKPTIACGCFEGGITHGHTRGRQSSPLYNLWRNIKTRCLNPRNHHFPFYGARGITFYKPWAASFERFATDLLAAIGQRPSQQHSLDRIDNTRGYEPGNLQWATMREQSRNRRSRRHA